MPETPSLSTEAYTPSRLIAGVNHNVVTDTGTILSGEAAADTKRGVLLGKVTLGAMTSAAKSGGNTGTGTCVVDATTPLLAGAQVGTYTARVITAVANGGVFRITDPTGRVLGDATIPPGAGASVTWSNQVKFALTDATTDFAAGDGFDITVAAGSGKFRVAKAANLDGSAVPDAILFDDVDASAADVAGAGVYLAGEFNSSAMTFGTGVTAAAAKDALRLKGIFLRSVVTA